MPNEFSVRSLQALVRKLNEDPSLLERDWREVVTENFALSQQQHSVISEGGEARDARLQAAFAAAAQHVRAGGKVRLSVQSDVSGERRLYLVARDADAAAPQSLIKCDPYCGDWEWDW